MNTPPQLGQNILVVMDNNPGSLDIVRAIASYLPQIAQTSFTLLCFCPMHYWGHGGEESEGLNLFMRDVYEEEERDFDLADERLLQAKSILLEAGVPSEHLQTRIATEDSLIEATMAELRRCQYSGVVVNHTQGDIVNRLLRRGITDIFRQIPEVEVWAVNPEFDGYAASYS